MNLTEASKVEKALEEISYESKVSKEDKEGTIWKLTLPFIASDGKKFRVYFFRDSKNKKLYFSDGGALLNTIEGCGNPQLQAIQQLVSTFGLSLMEDKTVMDITNRSLKSRVMAYIQAWCSVDGVIRIWKVKQEEAQNGL